MRTSLQVLITGFSVVLVGFTNAAQEGTLEQYLAVNQVRLGSHKIEIKPHKPTSGIAAGTLMLYGHIIAPPYEIERKGRQLWVNGVQAMPSLVAERQERARARPAASAKQEEIGRRMKALRREAIRIYAESKIGASAKIRALLAQNSDIISNVDVPDSGGEVCFNFSGSPVRRCWGMRSEAMANGDRRARNEESNLEEVKRYIERDLREGKFVAIDSNAQWMSRQDMRRDVNLVMKDATLSREAKIERLRKLAGFDTALDIVDNYSADEWKETR